MKKIIFVLLLAMTSMAFAEWPTKSVTIVVPAPAGGLSDSLARTMLPELEKQLGVTVVVKNIPGGNYLVAARRLTGNPNDNHTFLLNDAVWAAGTYFIDTNTAKQFKTVNMFAQSPMCLGSKFTITKEDFLKISQSKAQANVAVNGTNSVHWRWITNVGTGISWTEISYAGSAPIVAAVAGNQVDFSVLSIGAYRSMMDANKIRCQMVSTVKRNPNFPDVPTFRELGFKGTPGTQWFGFITQNDTTDEATQYFSAAVARVIKDGYNLDRHKKNGLVFEHVSTKEATDFFNMEITKFSK